MEEIFGKLVRKSFRRAMAVIGQIRGHAQKFEGGVKYSRFVVLNTCDITSTSPNEVLWVYRLKNNNLFTFLLF